MIKNDNVFIRAYESSDLDMISVWRRNEEGGSLYLGLVGASPLSELAYTLGKAWTKFLIIGDAKNNRPFGIIKLEYIKFNEKIVSFHIDIGERDYFGKPYPFEAAKLLISYLFSEENITRLYSYVLDYQKEISSILEKLNFIKEASLKEHLYYDNSYHDVSVYGLLKEEFRG